MTKQFVSQDAHAVQTPTEAEVGSVGVVHTQFLQFHEPLPLSSGQTIHAYELAIETYGTLNA